MALSEKDLELIQDYLDGALSEADAALLDRRYESSPEFARELQEQEVLVTALKASSGSKPSH